MIYDIIRPTPPTWANWPICATPGCERHAYTDDYCRDCACEMADVPETVEINA